jgi:hypothetical protein
MLDVVRLCSPRDQSIEVLSHREEVEYSCWLIAKWKFCNLGTSPYVKNLILLNVLNKSFAHRIAKT